jgi:hypothetical protein
MAHSVCRRRSQGALHRQQPCRQLGGAHLMNPLVRLNMEADTPSRVLARDEFGVIWTVNCATNIAGGRESEWAGPATHGGVQSPAGEEQANMLPAAAW